MSRVALIGENSVEYIDVLLNIWNSGNCAVLLDWRIPARISVKMMLEANVELCFVQEKFYSKIVECNSNSNIKIVPYLSSTNQVSLLPLNIYDRYRENYSQDEAVVIYSSGTTGNSKGIILSHYAINTNADAIIDYMKPTSNDCIYMVKTISHASCLTGELVVALKTHTPLLIAPIIVPPRYTLTNVTKYNVTIMCINPTLLQMYMLEYDHNRMKYDLSSLKEIYVHGAKANVRLIQDARTVFHTISIYYEYGLTEAGPRVTTQKISSHSIDSVGKPINNVQVKVINCFGQDSPKNTYGNVHINTSAKYSGYISGNTKFQSLYNNWLNTGDIGYFDDNDELHIVGRVDDVIIINAHKIYPSEIESCIISYTSIKECTVTKVNYNNEDIVACLYVGDHECTTIKEILKSYLMSFEIPRLFVKCDELPRTDNGKISAIKIREYIHNIIPGVKI